MEKAEQQAHKDWALVVALGGPKKVADMLSWTAPGSVQRVQNWKFRGIPSDVKVDRPDLFLPNVRVLSASDGQGVGLAGSA